MISSPWWAPHVYADRRPFLLARNRISAAFRAWFGANNFMEVETAILQASPGNEAHLHAFATELEWYRADEPYGALIDDCAALLAAAAEAAGAKSVSFRGRAADPFAVPERLTVAEAFRRHAGIDLLATIDDREALAAAAKGQGIRVAGDDTWADVFSRVLTERIEPNLGIGRATILDEYPVSEAALARPTAHDRQAAERFELFVCGVETANAFGELTDPAEQRRRFESEMAEKERVHGEHYPLDEDFLAALGQMPPASGIALGFDRLVMLATGAQRIEQVLWTPVADPQ